MQTDHVLSEYRVNTSMAFVYDGIMEGGVSQIEINKRMASGSNIMDQYADFFLENEEDLEDSTPAPVPIPTRQQCCSNPVMVPMDDRARICQHCGMEEVYQPFEHAQGEVPLTCYIPLKRKKGQFCKSKPGKDGLCWRHSKQPRHQDDDD